MCKETLVIPVKRLVYQKRIIGKNGRPKDEERPPPPPKNAYQNLNICERCYRFVYCLPN
jgi:hypothetical protein